MVKLCCTSRTAIAPSRPCGRRPLVGDIVALARRAARGAGPAAAGRPSCGPCARSTSRPSAPRRGRRGGRPARPRRAAGRRDRGGERGRAVVRARPLRPAAAAADPRRAARPPGRRRADLRRLVPRPPGLRRPRRARARRAREPVAGAHARSPPSTCAPRARVGRRSAATDPRALARVAATPDERLPYLAPALRRLLEELPGARDGLAPHRAPAARAAVAAGARTREQAFLARRRAEEAPFLGDTIAFDRLEELARARTAGHRGARLTEPGADVLAGRADRVALSASTAGSAACTCAPTARCGAGTRERGVARRALTR